MTTSPRSHFVAKLYRISLHLACLFIHPAAHMGFHLSGIAREFCF
jgi:hypothetical protein